MEIDAGAKFPLGQLAAPPGALRALKESGQTPGFFLSRHVAGDWGLVDQEDGRLNDQALVAAPAGVLTNGMGGSYTESP